MNRPAAHLTVLLLACSAVAQPVNVRGRVTDADDGAPVQGALVQLTGWGLQDTSDADGRFRIYSAGVWKSGRSGKAPEIAFGNGVVRLNLPVAQHVSIRLYGLGGRCAGSLLDHTLGPGSHTVALPARGRTAGAGILRLTCGDWSGCVNLACVDGAVAVSQRSARGRAVSVLQAAAAVDSLRLTRQSYVTRNVAVNTYQDSIEAMLVWRPFSEVSPWNTRIAASPVIDDSSTIFIQDLSTSSQWNFLGINIKGYSIPVFCVDSASVPRYTVTCTGVTGQWMDRPVPIPNDAAPDAQSDRHLCIVDKKLSREWGMWDAVKSGSAWQCGVGAASDLSGTGVRPPSGQANPWQLAHGARASGFPLIAGLIRVGEMRVGRIDHALALAYTHCRSRYFVPPASTAQGTTTDAISTRGIPMGGRVQLDPSISVDGLALSASGKVIARALQEYGAYICDYSGAINLYADGSPSAQTYWDSGMLTTYEINQVFNQAMLTRFRVLDLPAYYDNHN